MNHLKQLARILRTDGAVGTVAFLLTFTVVCLLGMHQMSLRLWGDRGIWDIWLEGGMLSMFGWGMWFWGALLAIGLAVRTRTWSLLVWSGILGLLLFDDALEIHERLAIQLRPTVTDASGLGELIVFTAMGIVCLTAAIIALVFTRRAHRGVHTALIVILAVGAVLGVGADAVQSLLERGTSWWLVVSLAEQIGEAMTGVAVVVAFVAWMGHGIDAGRPEPASAENAGRPVDDADTGFEPVTSSVKTTEPRYH